MWVHMQNFRNDYYASPRILDKNTSPTCDRMIEGIPCGAMPTHHIIWNSQMDNGFVCMRHAVEARERWAFSHMHEWNAYHCRENAEFHSNLNLCIYRASA